MLTAAAGELRATAGRDPDAAGRLALAADANQSIAAIGEIGASTGSRANLPVATADADSALGREAATVEHTTRRDGLPLLGTAGIAEGVALPAWTTAPRGATTTHTKALRIVVARAAAASVWGADIDAAALFRLLTGLIVRLAAARVGERVAAHRADSAPVLTTLASVGAGFGQRQTVVRPALAIEAAETVAAGEVTRPIAAEGVRGAADRLADVVNAVVPVAAIRAEVALPVVWLAADTAGADAIATIAIEGAERLLGPATAALAALGAGRGGGAELAFIVATGVVLGIADGVGVQTNLDAFAVRALSIHATRRAVRRRRIGTETGSSVAGAGQVAFVGCAADRRRPGHAGATLAGVGLSAGVAVAADRPILSGLLDALPISFATDAAVALVILGVAIDASARGTNAVLAAIAGGAIGVVGVAARAVLLGPFDAEAIGGTADAVVADVARAGAVLGRAAAFAVLADIVLRTRVAVVAACVVGLARVGALAGFGVALSRLMALVRRDADD
jgi:hypothetical protein